MATVRLHEVTTATPEQVVAAVTDFGPDRAQIFAYSTDAYLQVHSLDSTHADVTEGSHGIWERLAYDWSDPDRIVMTTLDSNLWGGASGHTYTLSRLADGRTAIDAVVVREGKNLQGRLLALVVGVAGERLLRGMLAKTVRAIEARNAA